MAELTSPFGQAGWYPSEGTKLRDSLSDYVNTNLNQQDGNVTAIVCPHAGYTFCGSICGASFSATANQAYEHIIIIGPSHHVQLSQQIAIPEAIKMQTEIGSSLINHRLLSMLSENDCIQSDDIFKKEHSIWMMLPFIHYLHPSAKISPIIVGNLCLSQVKQIAKKIRSLQNKRTLIVISSDFTHYGAAFNYTPFYDDISKLVYLAYLQTPSFSTKLGLTFHHHFGWSQVWLARWYIDNNMSVHESVCNRIFQQ